MKGKSANLLLITGLSIFLVLGVIFIIHPYSTDYEFVTITKNSQIYEKPIFITFNWKSPDELQVGKSITVWAEIEGLPYNKENPSEGNIEIIFDETQINYFGKDIKNENISEIDYLVFQPNSNHSSFKSNEINLRFITPKDVHVQYCDHNLEKECMLIENIIRPAPHDLAVQIDTNRMSLVVSLVISSFSSIVVWSILRQRKMKNDS